MFVDTAKVQLQAGKGGDGAVSFRREIYIPKGGPDGGDGGKGGSIVFVADKDTNTLLDFRYNPILKAKNGKNGAGQRAAGRGGEDLIVEVPIGTLVYRLSEDGTERTLLADLTHDRQSAVIAQGGDGGFGNAHFKSSTRQTSRIAEVGEPGEAFEAELELKLLADVGLVGLPNAGKSTFLSVVTNAKPEIADYAFTTITPNLGVATIDGRDLLIADIPGLIEGASEGKGLGHAFLRHVDRTAVLLHLVDAYSDDAGKAYAVIRHELEKYSDLRDRPEIVALTKCEGLDRDLLDMQRQAILAVNPAAQILEISSLAHQGLDQLLRALAACIAAQASVETTDDEQVGGNATAGYASGQPVFTGGRRCSSACRPADAASSSAATPLPVISLSPHALRDTWTVTKDSATTDSGELIFHVTGEKIEKFARRTDLTNYASVNRLRDILKKLGIRAELTNQGAGPDSIIEIAGKEFTLVEDY